MKRSSPSFDLTRLGWDRSFAAAFDALEQPELMPARVGIEHNHLYRVYTHEGELMASTAGKLRHQAAGPEALPAVGDWVAVRVGDDRQATICAILPRRTSFCRKAAGDPTKRQVVTANIDTVFLVSGLEGDFNPRRVERYLVAAAESGATPVIVLNKTDLCDSVKDAVQAVRSIAPLVPVYPISCLERQSLEPLVSYLQDSQTVALLGSSGVGKSTIINCLLGQDRQRTQRIRKHDRRGRHTTVHRELLVRPDGGVIIDTPGMRELQLWDTNRALEAAFEEIDGLAPACRFRDCQHRTEPGCAVRQAVEKGQLPPERLEHYHQLQDERASLHGRRNELSHMAEKRRTTVSHREAKATKRLPH